MDLHRSCQPFPDAPPRAVQRIATPDRSCPASARARRCIRPRMQSREWDAMNVLTARRLPDEAERVADLVPWMQQLATKGDAEGVFPTAELEGLRQAGILAIPLPKEAPYWA